MAAYYNELDPSAAAWLRELIRRNLIAPGDVDERSIADVKPSDLMGYRQCHFFAGIGIWSYALRLADWPDDQECWTGSCPCQPFSAAGKGEGYADERHLWPHWHRLIGERRPAAIFGEQVDAAIRTGWLDDVCLSLESLGYAVGAISFPACSVGAPHIRQRLYFVANSAQARRSPYITWQEPNQRQKSSDNCEGRELWPSLVRHGATCELADTTDPRRPGARQHDGGSPSLSTRSEQCSADGIMGNADNEGSQGRQLLGTIEGGNSADRRIARSPGATNGFWHNAEWIACRDGKSRPVEPGVTPLVTGTPARVVKLRGYGNSINAEAAKAFIQAYMSIDQ